jgi:hypothetical protein
MIISRSIPLVEVRGRTLEGFAYEYAHPSKVTDDQGATYYYEQLLRDCDRKTIRDRASTGHSFPLQVWHGTTSNKGVMPPDEIGEVEFRPTDEGLAYKAVLSRGRLADEMLDMVDDETARDVSVSYKPMRDIEGTHDGYVLVSRAEIALKELSLCPTGTAQHDGAKVLVMRSSNARPSAAEIRLRLLDLA